MFGLTKTKIPVEAPSEQSLLWNDLVNGNGLVTFVLAQMGKGRTTVIIPWSATGAVTFSRFIYNLKDEGFTITDVDFNRLQGVEQNNDTAEQMEFAKRTVLDYVRLFPNRINLFDILTLVGTSFIGLTAVSPNGTTVQVVCEGDHDEWFDKR